MSVVKTTAERVDIARASVAVVRAAGPLGDLHTVYAPWENLSHLSAGQAIRVIRTGGMQVSGTLADITEEGITVARPGKKVFVERGRIRKVRILVKSRAGTGYNVGAAVGFFAAFAALAAAISQGNLPECDAGILEVTALGGGKASETLVRLFDEYQTIYVSARH